MKKDFKTIGTGLIFFILSISLFSCGKERKIDNLKVKTAGKYEQSMTQEAATQLQKEIGAFEITAEQRVVLLQCVIFSIL